MNLQLKDKTIFDPMNPGQKRSASPSSTSSVIKRPKHEAEPSLPVVNHPTHQSFLKNNGNEQMIPDIYSEKSAKLDEQILRNSGAFIHLVGGVGPREFLFSATLVNDHLKDLSLDEAGDILNTDGALALLLDECIKSGRFGRLAEYGKLLSCVFPIIFTYN